MKEYKNKAKNDRKDKEYSKYKYKNIKTYKIGRKKIRRCVK